MDKPKPASRAQASPRVKRGGLTIALLVLQSLLAFGAHWLLLMQLMGVAGCAEDCDYTLLQNTVTGHQLSILGSFMLTSVWLAIQLKRRRLIWWVPLAGSALILVATVVCYILIYQGLS